MHDRQGNLTRQPYAKDEQQAILSVGRSRLNATLLNAAEHTSSVEFCFEQKGDGFTRRRQSRAPRQRVPGSRPDRRCRRRGECGSPISGGPEVLPKRDGTTGARVQGAWNFRLDKDGMLDPPLHIWPRGGEMAIALPNPDGTFTGTLFFANETFDRFRTRPKPETICKRITTPCFNTCRILTSNGQTIRLGSWAHFEWISGTTGTPS